MSFYRDCLLNEKCLSHMNETETLKFKECLMDAKCTGIEHTLLSRAFDIHHKRATEQSVNGKTFLNCQQDKTCNTSVAFTLSS
jgi:transmembrane protein 8A/B